MSYTDYGLESSPKYSEIDDTLVFHNRSRELFTLRTLLLDGNDVPRTNQSMYVQVLAFGHLVNLTLLDLLFTVVLSI